MTASFFASLAFGAVVAAPAGFLALLSLAALRARLRTQGTNATHQETSESRNVVDAASRGHLCLVVPAHDEERDIATTVANLLAQSDADFSVHVVADNCTDATAARAREAGAIVWERSHDTKRSKGYALEWAIPRVREWALVRGGARYLAIIDADATLSPGSCALARAAFARGERILQSEYMLVPGHALRARVASLGFAAMNVARGLGRSELGLGDFLKGNGMWFDTRVLDAHPWRAYSLAEDFEYSLALSAAGERVAFLRDSIVTGLPARTSKGLGDQRVRWEAGRLALVLAELPPRFRRFLASPSLEGLNALLELSIPPLALTVFLYLLMCLLPWPWRVGGLAGVALLALHVLLTVPVARLPVRTFGVLAVVPFYVAWKIALLPAIWARRRSKAWLRAARALPLLLLPAFPPAPEARAEIPPPDAAGVPANARVFCVGYGPWIEQDDALDLHPTIVRWGGNTASRFNPAKGNLWNAGKDWHYRNVGKGSPDLARVFLKRIVRAGATPQFTLPILGWVAKDATAEGNPTKGDPGATSVPLDDAALEAWVRVIREIVPGERIYPLDNEPFLWHQTHADVVPKRVEPRAFAERWLHYARLVRRADPDARLTGPGLWGYGDLENLAPFLDKVLGQTDARGVPLLSIVTTNLYPQNADLQADYADVTGRKPVSETSTKAKLRVETAARVDDPAFVDPSWVKKPVALVSRIRAILGERAAAAKLPVKWMPSVAVTEYNWGAPDADSGAAAQALLLQAFLRNGVDHACTFTWPPPRSKAGRVFRAYAEFFAPRSAAAQVRVLAETPPTPGSLWAARGNETVLFHIPLAGDAPLAAAYLDAAASAERFSPAGFERIEANSLRRTGFTAGGIYRLVFPTGASLKATPKERPRTKAPSELKSIMSP